MRGFAFVFMACGSLAIAGYAWVTYLSRPLGTAVHPDMQAVYEVQRVGIYTHIFASSVALLLGPWQFLPAWRTAYPRVHRVMGRLYLGVGVLIGGLSGLYMALFAFGGIVSTLGFLLLSVVWLWTGWQAFDAARKRNFVAHRRWMVRNFSLALAALTLRIGLGVGFASGLPFEDFYPVLAWLSWIPNLLFAEVLLARTNR